MFCIANHKRKTYKKDEELEGKKKKNGKKKTKGNM